MLGVQKHIAVILAVARRRERLRARIHGISCHRKIQHHWLQITEL